MKTTKEMIKEDIWAGLNRKDIGEDQADIVVFGIPFDGSVSFRSGTKDGPRSIREITYTIAPTTEKFESLKDLKIKDIGDFEDEDRDKLFLNVEKTVENFVKKDKFFTMIGGDHSTTIPVLRGIDKGLNEEFGIIHIDAHFDLCNTLEGDFLSHGSTQRRALELNNINGPENLFFIGIRSIEEDELEFINKNPVQVISAYDYSKFGTDKVLERVKEKMGKFNKIYITIDIDCLDPAYAAGTGTPQFGGLTSRELLNLLEGLFELPVIGFDVVEVAPNLDPALTSVFAARKILTECFGHFLKKLNK